MTTRLKPCNWCGMSDQSCEDEACPQQDRAALQEPTAAMYESAHGHYEGAAFLPHGLWQARLNASPLAPEGGRTI